MRLTVMLHPQPDDVVFGILPIDCAEGVCTVRTDGNAVERPCVPCIAARSRRRLESKAAAFLYGNGFAWEWVTICVLIIGDFNAVLLCNADNALVVRPVV